MVRKNFLRINLLIFTSLGNFIYFNPIQSFFYSRKMTSMSSIPVKQLSNGLKMPVIGLGTYKERRVDVLSAAIKSAIDAGYRHFDCAYCYYNEEVIGDAIRRAINETNLKREDFFIVSKLWNTFHSKSKVEKALDDSLKRFGFDYLDLFLIHWPMGFKV